MNFLGTVSKTETITLYYKFIRLTTQVFNCIIVTVETNTEDTMEIFVYYVLPNIALFGGIALFAKTVEYAMWYFINNYDIFVKRLNQR